MGRTTMKTFISANTIAIFGCIVSAHAGTTQCEQSTFNTSNPADAKALAACIQKSSGTISVDGQTYKVNPSNGILQNPATGAWNKLDPTTGVITPAHSGTEYSYGGKTYHSLEDAQAAGLDKQNPNQVTVTKYNDNGEMIGSPVTVAQAQEHAKQKSTEQKTTAKTWDDCQKSYDYAVRELGLTPEEASKKYKCSQTQTVAKGAQIANEVLTGTGRNVVNQMGAQAAKNTQNGTFINAQQGAAKMAKTSFAYETSLGMANTAAAVVLAKKAYQHKQNLGALNAQAMSEDGNAVLNDETGGLRSGADSAKLKLAIQEQKGAQALAATAAMKSTMVAAQSIAGASVAKKNQKAAETNAKLAQQAATTASQAMFNYDPSQLAAQGGLTAYDPNAGAGTTTTGQNDGKTTTTDNVDPNAPGGPMLGSGNDLGAGSDALNAPQAGAFKSGSAGGGGGGGGGGGSPSLGGGGGGGGAGSQEESKAAYASEFGTKERYENGSNGAPGAKGGAKGGSSDTGIDLNGLLAQFLPKSEEDLGSKNGILDSVDFGGRRNIANEEAPSYLDKNADLFQRIHETMSEKNRRGQLGI